MVNQKKIWKRNCPKCNDELLYSHRGHYNDACKKNRHCNVCANKVNATKLKLSPNYSQYKQLLSDVSNVRSSNPEYRQKLSASVKLAMNRPEVRKKHLDALSKSDWLKVKTDVGQLELIEKWNRIGFVFEPNHRVKTELDLFYVDGYDKQHGVVLEFDTKYHYIPHQMKKDFVRQQKIIDILKPKKFWRYNSVMKLWTQVL